MTKLSRHNEAILRANLKTEFVKNLKEKINNNTNPSANYDIH